MGVGIVGGRRCEELTCSDFCINLNPGICRNPRLRELNSLMNGDTSDVHVSMTGRGVVRTVGLHLIFGLPLADDGVVLHAVGMSISHPQACLLFS